MTELPLVNLTGRPLNVYSGRRQVMMLPAAGPQFRLVEAEQDYDVVCLAEVVTVRLSRRSLPPETLGRWLVVTQTAAIGLALMGEPRQDILFPGPGVTDRHRVVGCQGFRRLAAQGTRWRHG